MDEQQISLKSLYQLRMDGADQPIRYRIPSYQRGYRWTPKQVIQLLEDIRDFTHRENPHPEDFYCLQPLVLRPNADTYEVVDGQQRLTTLLLILRHFNERLAERFQQKLYSLQYDTRPDLAPFLANPSEELAASNIDYFHIHQAIQTIAAWFEQHDSEVEDIKSAFLNKAKVIWFQLAAEENAVEAFTRLNVGKIPLTNGELIRALFLKRSGSADSEGDALRLRIAHEWDQVEKGLQNPEFWHFISNDVDQQGNRIGFLFDLVARAEGMVSSDDTYATFYHYSSKLTAKAADPEAAWLEVKKTFMLLEEWFDDRRLYHLVGFLICERLTVNQLRDLASGCTKREFKEKLRARIYARIIESAELSTLSADELREHITDRIDDLEYGRHRPRIRAILLLFNLATLLQNPDSTIRFQFESYKTVTWDIEHVRSVALDRPASRKGQQEWLDACLGYFQSTDTEPDLIQEIQAHLSLAAVPTTDALFESLYEKILRAFDESDSDEADHSVANLVLLDSATNRSYKNAVFAVKRHRILSLDRGGVYVPLCTRNVFLKCYSPRVDHAMFWTEDDREGYREAIIDTLCTFFQGGWLHA